MSKKCRQCGNPLDSSGSCQICLLKLGISQGAEQSNLDQQLASLPSIAELNQHFPQLEITRLVGRGGMGAIYHARQTALDRDVALKIIAKEVAGNAAFIERFEREAKTLARLSHPNIVTIYDFGHTEDGQAYLIMEFVDGINLREAIASESVDHLDTLNLVSTICQALQYAHSKGVVHRDIKPENILLGEDGTVKVADFGIAKIVDKSVHTPTLTATRQVLGSLHYLAPEQIESPDQVDHRVDLYALGVIFYELLTGQLPLGRYEPPSVARRNVDQRLDPIVLKTLSRKPSHRYQSAAELESELQQLQSSTVRDKLPHTETFSTEQSSVSVPFRNEALWGLAETCGIVSAKPGVLSIEYRIRDAFSGSIKTETQVVSISTDQMTSAELVSGIFSTKIVIVADTIAALGNFPDGETGRVTFSINGADKRMAVEVVRVLGFSPASAYSPQASAISSTHFLEESTGWITFASLMIFCGILNAGLLAIGEVVVTDELDDIESIAAAVGLAILLGPVAALQIVTGLISIVAKPIGLARAASIVSMIPIAPGWFLSCPTGIWAYRWLQKQDSVSHDFAPQSFTEVSGGFNETLWGVTSFGLFKESRRGRRAVGIANVALIALAVGGIAAYRLDFYPNTMTYRIVSTEDIGDDLADKVRRRIQSAGNVELKGINHDSKISHQLEINIVEHQREAIRQMLAIEGDVQLVWLDLNDGADTEREVPSEEQSRVLDLALGMDLPKDAKRATTNTGDAAYSDSEPMVIESEYVSKLSFADGKLEIQLTKEGREKLVEASNGEIDFAGLGLLVDGVIEGIAGREKMSGKQLIFQLSSRSELSAESIIAAIRGPALPSDLELLE